MLRFWSPESGRSQNECQCKMFTLFVKISLESNIVKSVSERVVFV